MKRRGDAETRRRGDAERGNAEREDTETRRHGEMETGEMKTRRQGFPLPSPRLRVLRDAAGAVQSRPLPGTACLNLKPEPEGVTT
jgi:hypothetical protein